MRGRSGIGHLDLKSSRWDSQIVRFFLELPACELAFIFFLCVRTLSCKQKMRECGLVSICEGL